MSTWADPVAWAQLQSVEACVICRPGGPRDILAELETSWVTVKLNYEVHGNSIPHLHMHVFPRYPGDPFGGGPIDPKVARKPVYAPGEFAAMRARPLEALAGTWTPLS